MDAPKLEITASRQFTSWLAEQRVSLAFTTYQSGKLFLLGLKPDGRLSVFERTFERCMGLHGAAWGCMSPRMRRRSGCRASTSFGVLKMRCRQRRQTPDGYDRLYVPQCGFTTGDVDAHDVALDAAGRPVFVNTLFSCLAAASESHSFGVLWQPPFMAGRLCHPCRGGDFCIVTANGGGGRKIIPDELA